MGLLLISSPLLLYTTLQPKCFQNLNLLCQTSTAKNKKKRKKRLSVASHFFLDKICGIKMAGRSLQGLVLVFLSSCLSLLPTLKVVCPPNWPLQSQVLTFAFLPICFISYPFTYLTCTHFFLIFWYRSDFSGELRSCSSVLYFYKHHIYILV